MPERVTPEVAEREVSRGRSSCLEGAKGQRNRRRCPVILGNGLSQMFAIAKLADPVHRVKPDALRQRETKSGGSETSIFRRRAEIYPCTPTSTISTARCGPACRVVWEGSVRQTGRPYPDQQIYRGPFMADEFEFDLKTLKGIFDESLDFSFCGLHSCIPKVTICPDALAALGAEYFRGVDSIIGPSNPSFALPTIERN